MPRLNGDEALAGIRRVAPEMAVVLLTASDEDPSSCWQVRPEAIVRKTHHLDSLPHTIRRVLEAPPVLRSPASPPIIA
jgi:DNA-binding NarL/FixJ family response regulator